MLKKRKFFGKNIFLILILLVTMAFSVVVVSASGSDSSGLTVSSMFELKKDVQSYTENAALTSQSDNGRGFEVIGSGNITVRYKNKINLSAVSTNRFAEVQAVIRNGIVPATRLSIRLVDAYDSSNLVEIVYEYNRYEGDASYVCWRYRTESGSLVAVTPSQWENWRVSNSVGTSLIGGEVGIAKGTYIGEQGILAYTRSIGEGNSMGVTVPMDFTFDYQTGTFYISGHYGMHQSVPFTDAPVLSILDAQQVGANNIWKQFSSDEVFVEFCMDASEKSGYNIVSILGNSMAGTIVSDTTLPNIKLKENSLIENFANMPNAVVNMAYPIPEIQAFDYVSGVKDINVKVADLAGKVILDSAYQPDLTFKPTEKGKYQITYSISDYSGNVTNKQLIVNALDFIEAPKVEFAQTPKTAIAGQEYTIPDVVISGGLDVYDYEQIISFNGLKKDKTFIPEEEGEILVSVYGKDYIGNTVSQVLTIDVIEKDEINLNIEKGMPIAAIVGTVCTLPDFTAINYAKEGADRYAKKWIEVNGERIEGAAFEVKETLGSNVNIQYFASDKSDSSKVVSSEIITLPVVKPTYVSDYFLYDKSDIQVSYSNSVRVGLYTQFAFNTSKELISIINPLSVENLSFKFGFSSSSAPIETLNLYLSDYKDSEKTIKISFIPTNGKTNVVINDNYAQLVSYNINLMKNNEYTDIVFNNLSSVLMRENGNFISRVDKTLSEAEFNGFTSGAVMVSFEVKTVGSSENVEFRLNAIANQAILNPLKSGEATQFKDISAPVLSLSKSLLNVKVEQNQWYVLPAAKAYDFCNPTSNVTLTIEGPTQTVCKNVDTSVEKAYKFTEIGVYKIIYKMEDNGIVYSIDYSVTVNDNIEPTIDVNTTAIKVKKDQEFTVPIATVTDNASVDLYVFLFEDAQWIYVEQGKTLSISKSGKYQLVYYAIDKSYNVKQVIIDVTVV